MHTMKQKSKTNPHIIYHQPNTPSRPAPHLTPRHKPHPPHPPFSGDPAAVRAGQRPGRADKSLRRRPTNIPCLEQIPYGGQHRPHHVPHVPLRSSRGRLSFRTRRRHCGVEILGLGQVGRERRLRRLGSNFVDVDGSDVVEIELDDLLEEAGSGAKAHVEAVGERESLASAPP